MRKSLTKRERLKKKPEFQRVFSSSRKLSVPGIKLFLLENGLTWNRIGVTFMRKYGNSVQRNKVKRIVKEIYRNSKSLLKPGFDMIIVVYPGADTYQEIEVRLGSLFRKAGIVAADNSNSS